MAGKKLKNISKNACHHRGGGAEKTFTGSMPFRTQTHIKTIIKHHKNKLPLMKKTTALLAGLLALSVHTHAALITHTTNFDSNPSDSTLAAPFVGSASFSYNRSAALADGFYTFNYLNSFSSALSISFNNGNSFSLADLMFDPSQFGVYLSGSSFIFAAVSGYNANNPGAGAFEKGSTLFYLEPIWVDHLGSKFYSAFQNTAVAYPFYVQDTAPINGASMIMGNYGFDISAINGASSGGGGGPAAVPEPGQVAASLLLLAGIGGYVFVKRRKAVKTAPAA
jgi:hypothetical protein